jgi:hypothetical protein
MLLKMDRGKLDPAKVKEFVGLCLFRLETDSQLKGLKVYLDVDPY